MDIIPLIYKVCQRAIDLLKIEAQGGFEVAPKQMPLNLGARERRYRQG